MSSYDNHAVTGIITKAPNNSKKDKKGKKNAQTRPGLEPATFSMEVSSTNHYTTKLLC
jgi:hypothetical protein